MLYEQKVQLVVYLVEITIRATDKIDKKGGWGENCWDNRTGING